MDLFACHGPAGIGNLRPAATVHNGQSDHLADLQQIVLAHIVGERDVLPVQSKTNGDAQERITTLNRIFAVGRRSFHIDVGGGGQLRNRGRFDNRRQCAPIDVAEIGDKNPITVACLGGADADLVPARFQNVHAVNPVVHPPADGLAGVRDSHPVFADGTGGIAGARDA